MNPFTSALSQLSSQQSSRIGDMENNIIFSLRHYSEVTTDYQDQTVDILKQHNTIVIVDLEPESTRPKGVQKQAGIFYFRPHTFYFSRHFLSPQFRFVLNFWLLVVKLSFSIPQFWRRKKTLWMTDPESYDFFKSFRQFFNLTLFDMVDFIEKKENKRKLTSLISEVDLVCVNSERLFELYHPYNKNTVVVPQGFRVKDFKRVKLSKKRHSLGYIGGINFRLDYPMLIELINSNPTWQFTFCGPIFNYHAHQKKLIDRLIHLKNVVYIPAVAKKDVPKILATFQVGLIPYNVKDPFNKNCYPMKTFEYFYAGLPVVSTPIFELLKFDPLVKIGKNAAEWEKVLSSLLTKPWPKKYQQHQKSLALENSWEKKLQAIYRAVETVT